MTKKIIDQVNNVNNVDNVDNVTNEKYFPLEKFEKSFMKIPIELISSDTHYASLNVFYSLKEQLRKLKKPLLSSNYNNIRIIAISDTHTMHDNLELPLGDILIFTGDCVGNYHMQVDLYSEFYNFLKFLYKKSFVYKHIVWIAGNHDTFLDSDYYDSTMAKSLISKLPSNVHYLENSEINILGLKIYGTPYLPSRLETMNKNYISNGFERYDSERKKIFKKIPEKLDILLTHCPINGLHPDNLSGDYLLRKRFNKMKNPPRVHCFGHSHNTFGVYERKHVKGKRTLHINSAQERLIAYQEELVPNNITGLPIVFDISKRKVKNKKRGKN